MPELGSEEGNTNIPLLQILFLLLEPVMLIFLKFINFSQVFM